MSGGESPIGFAIFVYLFGIPMAALIILVLALPAYLLMRRHWEITWWNAALSGFVIAAVPAVLLGLTDLSLLTVIQFGLLGAVGGLVFWAIVRPRRPGLRINPETFR